MKQLSVFCLALISLAACSSESKPPAQAAEPAKPSYFTEQKQSLTATVVAIDHNTRMVTLRGSEGAELTFKVDPLVRNLDQVNVGDVLAIGYYESLAINVQKPTTPINDVVTAGARAAPGEKPEGVAAQHTTITATIESIDRSVPSVTLRGPQGKLRAFKIRDPRKLDNVNVGDQVVITYTEALAVSVEEVK